METAAADAALLVLRLVVGSVFLAHGIKHLINRSKTIRWTESIGFRRPTLQWSFMTFAEMGIGAGLVAGFLTSLAASGLVAMLAVAFWTVHRRAGFWITARPDEGYEYVLVLSVAAAALAMLGPGGWSLDRAVGIDGELDGWTGLVIVVGGLLAAFVQLAVFYRPGEEE